MTGSGEEFLRNRLESRAKEGLLRRLVQKKAAVDFSSNDYLGFVRDNILTPASLESGATGSRLLSGNREFTEQTEQEIAIFHNAEAALIFNSGYDANLGVFSSIPGRGDTILYDALCHASIRDGIRLSFADAYSFEHNDVDSLKRKLGRGTGKVFVAVESVYSMDGDLCPLKEFGQICRETGAHLIVDEAHATGVFGEKGEGLVQAQRLESEVFARVHTYGKALGCHGASVVGSQAMREYLINFARSFIYTTALPPHTISLIADAYRKLSDAGDRRRALFQIIHYFESQMEKLFSAAHSVLGSQIKTVVLPGNERCRKFANALQEKGFDVRPILSPTVPEEKERLRICLHSFNSIGEVKALISAIEEELHG
jgi:8-amino-7-oxononanoate synthase